MRTPWIAQTIYTNVGRIHAIFTPILEFVKSKAVHHGESIFVCAFGLSGPTVTCDLISLLEHRLEYMADPGEDLHGCDGYEALIDLAKQHGAPQAEPWIRKHLSEEEARILCKCLRFDKSLIPKLIELIPSQITIEMGKTAAKASMWTKSSTWSASIMQRIPILCNFSPTVTQLEEESEAALVRDSEAYKLARQIIEDSFRGQAGRGGLIQRILLRMEQPKPRPVQDVSEIMTGLLQSKVPSSAAVAQTNFWHIVHARARSSPLHDRIHELLAPIKPYIFGGTPMCKALNDAKAVFIKINANPRVLFLLSDGLSTDGDPLPIARNLRGLGVTIVTCFLTSAHIDNPRRLLDEVDPDWGDGRSVLFKMSSTVRNTDSLISGLIAMDANWKLPPSGVSHLFVQANTLEVVNEFCEKVVSQINV